MASALNLTILAAGVCTWTRNPLAVVNTELTQPILSASVALTRADDNK